MIYQDVLFNNNWFIGCPEIPKGHVRVAGWVGDVDGRPGFTLRGYKGSAYESWVMPMNRDGKTLVSWGSSFSDDDGHTFIDIPFWLAKNMRLSDKYGNLRTPKGDLIATKKQQVAASEYLPF